MSKTGLQLVRYEAAFCGVTGCYREILEGLIRFVASGLDLGIDNFSLPSDWERFETWPRVVLHYRLLLRTVAGQSGPRKGGAPPEKSAWIAYWPTGNNVADLQVPPICRVGPAARESS